jgi:hypothetical protein
VHYLHFYLYCDLIKSDGIQEVSGSIPLISTKSPEINSISGLFLCFLAYFSQYSAFSKPARKYAFLRKCLTTTAEVPKEK